MSTLVVLSSRNKRIRICKCVYENYASCRNIIFSSLIYRFQYYFNTMEYTFVLHNQYCDRKKWRLDFSSNLGLVSYPLLTEATKWFPAHRATCPPKNLVHWHVRYASASFVRLFYHWFFWNLNRRCWKVKMINSHIYSNMYIVSNRVIFYVWVIVLNRRHETANVTCLI